MPDLERSRRIKKKKSRCRNVLQVDPTGARMGEWWIFLHVENALKETQRVNCGHFWGWATGWGKWDERDFIHFMSSVV